jgi:hypothetical protein
MQTCGAPQAMMNSNSGDCTRPVKATATNRPAAAPTHSACGKTFNLQVKTNNSRFESSFNRVSARTFQ